MLSVHDVEAIKHLFRMGPVHGYGDTKLVQSTVVISKKYEVCY